jgi:hypothetical protein
MIQVKAHPKIDDSLSRRHAEDIMVKTTARLMLASAALVGAMCFETSASYAFGDAPWCAVIEIGTGAVYWDCQYPTLEACVPNVLAGNRGFCNLNPAPGPSAGGVRPYPHHRWRYLRHPR